jgi:hypothetical protein
MANTKISDLTADSSITGIEEMVVADSGNTRKIGLDDLAVYVKGTAPVMFHCSPKTAALPVSNPAAYVQVAGSNVLYDVLDFDKTTGESAYWQFALPTGIVIASATIEIYSTQASVTSGDVGWLVKTLVRGAAEAIDTAPVSDTVTATTVEGTAGLVHRQTKALTITSWAGAHLLLVTITRDVANDNANEDARFLGAVLRIN